MDFTKFIVGDEYDRPTLAQMWGYKTYNAISRGVVTPKGKNLVILFVTREKQEHLTPYEDHIDQDILFWEGEEKHGSDHRIAKKSDVIHVFFRERHHTPFTYKGRAALLGHKLYSNRPSKFTFQLVDQVVTQKDLVQEVRELYGLPDTVKEAIIKSRRGQGLYRERSLQLWKTCSVTGFTNSNLLIASHIKPWKVSDNVERLDPFNSLILVPSLDKLFDLGYIGFENNGKIMISDRITSADLKRIGVTSDLRLKQIPRDTKRYLMYHQEYKFDLIKD